MDRKKPTSKLHQEPKLSLEKSVQEIETARRMAEAATNFLESLRAEQRQKLVYPVDSNERLNWHYTPRERKGISFKEMNGEGDRVIELSTKKLIIRIEESIAQRTKRMA